MMNVGGVEQPVARQPHKLKVTGSSPVTAPSYCSVGPEEGKRTERLQARFGEPEAFCGSLLAVEAPSETAALPKPVVVSIEKKGGKPLDPTEFEQSDDDERTPILWHSNAPWTGTGYGMQSALFGPRIAEQLDYRLAFSAFYGLQGSKIGWQSDTGKGYIVYPAGRDAYGNDVMGAHHQDWARGRKGLFICLTDPWVLHAPIVAQLPAVAWTPIDHDPLIPRNEEWLFRTEAVPIAMSRFGQRVMEEAGLRSLYVPHGFNPDCFQVGNREAARDFFNIPQDAFVVGMVAANKGAPSRKGFAQAIRAFAQFKKDCPEALLYLHTQLESPDGENIVAICDSENVAPMSTDQYKLALGQPPRLVAGLMNAFDVLLNPSTGEGFGIPILEAQACGCPAIVTNFSSMPEVAPDQNADGDSLNWWVDGSPLWTAFESWQATPDIEHIVVCLKAAYEEPSAERLQRRADVAEWALSEYAVDHVVEEYWKPVLRECLLKHAFMDKRMKRHTPGA